MNAVPAPLRARLGDAAIAGLLDLLHRAGRDWTADVMGITGERFERRLSEETSKLRVEMAHGFAGLREEMAAGQAALRQEMAQGQALIRQEMLEHVSALRQGMADLAGTLRQEMAAGFSDLRNEIADDRFELFKWAFLFWIGQFFAVAGLMLVLIRSLRVG